MKAILIGIGLLAGTQALSDGQQSCEQALAKIKTDGIVIEIETKRRHLFDASRVRSDVTRYRLSMEASEECTYSYSDGAWYFGFGGPAILQNGSQQIPVLMSHAWFHFSSNASPGAFYFDLGTSIFEWSIRAHHSVAARLFVRDLGFETFEPNTATSHLAFVTGKKYPYAFPRFLSRPWIWNQLSILGVGSVQGELWEFYTEKVRFLLD